MKFKHLSLIFAFIFTSVSLVQAQDKEVLFTIDKAPVYASEFIRVYNKNLDLVKDESQKDIDGYLKLFINYKLKLQEAKRLELDKKPSYLREFESYKNQLAKNYLTDNKVTDALVEEAHNRLKTEVNASHVLVRIDENASPKDTLAAYNEIVKLRERVINEDYKVVQKDVHNGKTIFAEDLGYFSAFKMVYPFENAAFNTNVGEVSQPFRTRFGYHVVIVFNKREARGEVSVAHIMIKTEKENDTESETKINEIYKRIQQGEAFDALAKQLSEDKSTSSKGGLLKPFSSGEISAQEFEDVAFNLKNIDDVSKPFKTQFGWHIVKLKAKKGIQPLAEMKPQLESKIKRDSRSKVINDSRIKVLKAKYTVTESATDLSYFKEILNKDYFNNRWSLPSSFDAEKTFIKIEDKTLSYNDFGQFLIKNQKSYSNRTSAISVIVDKIYETFLENELQKYQEDNLITENSDYAQIVGEYRDGLLLFDLMETEIWNVAKNDSVALEKYYNSHKSSYFFSERVDVVVASSAKKSIIKKIAKLMKKGADIEAIKNLINTKDQVNVSFSSGEMDGKHQALPEQFSFKKGVSKVYKHNDGYIVANVKSVLSKTPKTFKEAKGRVTSDYQSFKEENWLKELAFKYTIKVNQDVLSTIKQTLKK
ncbi:peptidylprolyl isomerase [Lacinutrix sp. Bg11-31]|uniref:peptidylprolyl isomerase n=1 Tax=Lacinutrix sp. Bg11-31 TaxID=2057808 RepID=UPI000C3121A8|nr:peptidylprolyl isomerase [Lacinutrix sp. Bg11-31]AUC82010.1 peptidylprolyl isomerase [Lacinutrix sp. Bg11-31]